jgi:hypothetical protein
MALGEARLGECKKVVAMHYKEEVIDKGEAHSMAYRLYTMCARSPLRHLHARSRRRTPSRSLGLHVTITPGSLVLSIQGWRSIPWPHSITFHQSREAKTQWAPTSPFRDINRTNDAERTCHISQQNILQTRTLLFPEMSLGSQDDSTQSYNGAQYSSSTYEESTYSTSCVAGSENHIPSPGMRVSVHLTGSRPFDPCSNSNKPR